MLFLPCFKWRESGSALCLSFRAAPPHSHKDKVIGSFGFHVLVGFGMTAVPTYHLGMAVFGFAPPMLF